MEERRTSLSARAPSVSAEEIAPRQFQDKHKLGQFTSSQSNFNSGDFDASRREKVGGGGGGGRDCRSTRRTHNINFVDTTCRRCCFHLDCCSFIDFICSPRCLTGRLRQLCTPRQLAVISEAVFFLFRRSLTAREKPIVFLEVKRREEPHRPRRTSHLLRLSGSFHSSPKCSPWLPSRPFQRLQPGVAPNINTATSCAWTGGGGWNSFCASGAAN